MIKPPVAISRCAGRPARALLSPLFLACALLAFACGDNAGEKSTPTPSDRPTPTDATAIRSVDFTQVAAFQTLLRQSGGGEYDRRDILYADVTGDGREEAIIPVSSGGTLGNIAYQVFTLRAGSPLVVLTALRDQSTIGGLRLTVEDGKLVKTIGKYGPEDPRCCPSGLVKTYYRWDGATLQVDREEEVKATPGPKQ